MWAVSSKYRPSITFANASTYWVGSRLLIITRCYTLDFFCSGSLQVFGILGWRARIDLAVCDFGYYFPTLLPKSGLRVPCSNIMLL